MKAEGVCTPGTRSPEASGAPPAPQGCLGVPCGPRPTWQEEEEEARSGLPPSAPLPLPAPGGAAPKPPRGLPRPCCGPRGGGASAPSPSCWGTLEGGERSWGQRGKGKGRETKGMEGHGRAGVASSSKHPPRFGVPARGVVVCTPLSPPQTRGAQPRLCTPRRVLPSAFSPALRVGPRGQGGAPLPAPLPRRGWRRGRLHWPRRGGELRPPERRGEEEEEEEGERRRGREGAGLRC